MKGIDVSNHNGNINFKQVKVAGVEAIYIKATEGTTFTDSYLDTNYSNAHYAGLKTGFYHFLVGSSSPETQATSFYNAIKGKTNDLIPMLDIETKFDGLMDYVIRFINKFKEISSLPIGVYTYTGFMDNLDNRIANYPLWEANYNNSPWNLQDNFFNNRVGHQYSETGTISGINASVDINEFNDGILSSTIKLGWNKSSKGQWYCTDVANYCYYKAQWQEIYGDWYYFDDNGYAKCDDWFQTNGKWYYLKDNYKMAKSEWIWDDGECYCFDSNGAMYVNCITPDGYKVDKTGAWVQ